MLWLVKGRAIARLVAHAGFKKPKKMGVIMKAIVFVLILNGVSSQQFQVNQSERSPPMSSYSNGDVRNCIFDMEARTTSPRVLETLPGLGFDNLRNFDMDRVHSVDYTTCRMTSDGKYLLPDGYFIVPQYVTDISLFSEYFNNWYDYRSLTSSSINIGGSLGFNRFSISGSHSEENRRVKIQQVQQNSATTRVQVRRVVYTVKLDSSVSLHPEFRKRVYEIAANLAGEQDNLAHYCAELLVRDYGTHFLTSIDVGGVFAKNDFISRIYTGAIDFSEQKLTYAASIGFPGFSVFNSSFERGNSELNVNLYHQNLTASDVVTIGGPPITEEISISNWQNGIMDNLGIIDRFGDPLSFAITPGNFPEVDGNILRNVSRIIQETADRYFDDNNIPGCVDVTDSNFNFQANNPSNESCGRSNTTRSYLDRSLGGVYQTCYHVSGPYTTLCKEVEQTNKLTGGYSCPRGYQAILLNSGSYSVTSTYSRSYEDCTLLIFCSDEVDYYTEPTFVRYNTYWCVITKESQVDQGQLFGGYYSLMVTNPFTSTRSCPTYYQPHLFGRSIQLCTSSDLELGASRSVKFGGFFSCFVGNPLVNGPYVGSDSSSWIRTCPRGYTQHLVTIDSGCAISICLEMGSYGRERLYQPKLPPYRTPHFNPNGSEPIAILGSRNTVLIKNIQGEWETYNISDPVVVEILSSSRTRSSQASSDTPSSSRPSGVAIAALVFSVLTIVAITIFSIVVIIKARK